jgi:hypothetical protein
MSEETVPDLTPFTFQNETTPGSGVWAPLHEFMGTAETAATSAQALANSTGQRVRVIDANGDEVGVYELQRPEGA